MAAWGGDTARITQMVKLAQREHGLASPPGEPVAGPEASTVPIPLGPLQTPTPALH